MSSYQHHNKSAPKRVEIQKPAEHKVEKPVAKPKPEKPVVKQADPEAPTPTQAEAKDKADRSPAEQAAIEQSAVDKDTSKKKEPKTVKCVNCTEMLPLGTDVCPNCMYLQP